MVYLDNSFIDWYPVDVVFGSSLSLPVSVDQIGVLLYPCLGFSEIFGPKDVECVHLIPFDFTVAGQIDFVPAFPEILLDVLALDGGELVGL